MRIKTTGHAATVTVTPKDEDAPELDHPEHQPPASGDAEPEGDAEMRE